MPLAGVFRKWGSREEVNRVEETETHQESEVTTETTVQRTEITTEHSEVTFTKTEEHTETVDGQVHIEITKIKVDGEYTPNQTLPDIDADVNQLQDDQKPIETNNLSMVIDDKPEKEPPSIYDDAQKEDQTPEQTETETKEPEHEEIPLGDDTKPEANGEKPGQLEIEPKEDKPKKNCCTIL